jgi:hypothetical protein
VCLININSNLTDFNKSNLGSEVSIINYTQDNPFIAPNDGYIRANSWGSNARTYYINDIVGTSPANSSVFIFVKKGFRLYGGGGIAYTNLSYYPLA